MTLGLEFTGTYDTVQRNFDRLNTDLDLVIVPPQARVYNSANISITNVTITALTFDSERYDNGDLHSTSSNTGRLTASVAGLYVIGGQAAFASNATGFRLVAIRLNGATRIASDSRGAVNGDTTAVPIATQYRLAEGDYVELQVYQNSGGALNVTAEGNSSPEFWMSRKGSYA